MRSIVVVTLLVIGVSGVALAAPPVPEIDPVSGASALALLAGAVVLVRGRRRI